MSLATNLIAILFIVVGYYSPIYGEELYSIGIFAFSGAITNWLAIHMLFEKVPGLYGSGIIPNRFEEFKLGIRKLVMSQFFTRENLERFLENIGVQAGGPEWHRLAEAIDFSKLFYALIDQVKESKFGGMLMMLGGEAALSTMEEPFTRRMKVVVNEMLDSESFKAKVAEITQRDRLSETFLSQVETIVEKRLNELTPELVKEIVQEMIREHLGWLVVWGGVFGGLIGLASTFLP